MKKQEEDIVPVEDNQPTFIMGVDPEFKEFCDQFRKRNIDGLLLNTEIPISYRSITKILARKMVSNNFLK